MSFFFWCITINFLIILPVVQPTVISLSFILCNCRSCCVCVCVCVCVFVCSHVFNWKVSNSAELIRIRAYVYKECKEHRLDSSWSWRINLVALCRLNYFRTGTHLPCFKSLSWFWLILMKFYTRWIYFIAVTAWLHCVLIVIVSFTMTGLYIGVSSFQMLEPVCSVIDYFI